MPTPGPLHCQNCNAVLLSEIPESLKPGQKLSCPKCKSVARLAPLSNLTIAMGVVLGGIACLTIGIAVAATWVTFRSDAASTTIVAKSTKSPIVDPTTPEELAEQELVDLVGGEDPLSDPEPQEPKPDPRDDILYGLTNKDSDTLLETFGESCVKQALALWDGVVADWETATNDEQMCLTTIYEMRLTGGTDLLHTIAYAKAMVIWVDTLLPETNEGMPLSQLFNTIRVNEVFVKQANEIERNGNAMLDAGTRGREVLHLKELKQSQSQDTFEVDARLTNLGSVTIKSVWVQAQLYDQSEKYLGKLSMIANGLQPKGDIVVSGSMDDLTTPVSRIEYRIETQIAVKEFELLVDESGTDR